MIQAGHLDRRVKLQRKEVVRDPMGGEVVTWVDAATVFAGRRDFNGRERIMASVEMSETDTRWLIRWRDDVRAEWRLLEGDVVYDIIAIAEMGGRKTGLELTARRIQP